MAYGAKKILISDINPDVAIGVNIPFNTNSVFSSNYSSIDAIKSNLINFLLTNQDERYLNPNFGGNLRAFIFEQITTGNLDFLKETLQTQIAQNFPDVVVNDLQILQNPDSNQIFIELTYSILNTGLQNTLSIAF
jgi:phage baseplate assembly protein W